MVEALSRFSSSQAQLAASSSCFTMSCRSTLLFANNQKPCIFCKQQRTAANEFLLAPLNDTPHIKWLHYNADGTARGDCCLLCFNVYSISGLKQKYKTLTSYKKAAEANMDVVREFRGARQKALERINNGDMKLSRGRPCKDGLSQSEHLAAS